MMERILSGRFCPLTAPFPFRRSPVTAPLTLTSNTLNFLKGNLKYCPKQCKEVAYFALVRSTVEYGSVVWDPHTSKEKDKVERVNRRAARMASNDYGRRSSVTSMLSRLGWATLKQRRENQRLTMMYKVVYHAWIGGSTHNSSYRSRFPHQSQPHFLVSDYQLQQTLFQRYTWDAVTSVNLNISMVR